jgi:hypothetical protein
MDGRDEKNIRESRRWERGNTGGRGDHWWYGEVRK